MFGKDNKKKELIANLGEIYQKIEKEHQISPGDFPKLAKMQVRLKGKKKGWWITRQETVIYCPNELQVSIM